MDEGQVSRIDKAAWETTPKAVFTDDSGQGFVVDRVRDESLEARYFERVSFQESVSDPLGNTFVVERLAFREVDFTLTKTFPELELRMAPRGLRGFTSGLLKASGFSMELASQNVDLAKWVSAMERETASKISIRAAIAAGLELSGGATARIGIAGPTDVRLALIELTNNRHYLLESVQLEYSFGRSTQKIVLSSDSSVRYGDKRPQEVVDAVRVAFNKTARTIR